MHSWGKLNKQKHSSPFMSNLKMLLSMSKSYELLPLVIFLTVNVIIYSNLFVSISVDLCKLQKLYMCYIYAIIWYCDITTTFNDIFSNWINPYKCSRSTLIFHVVYLFHPKHSNSFFCTHIHQGVNIPLECHISLYSSITSLRDQVVAVEKLLESRIKYVKVCYIVYKK